MEHTADNSKNTTRSFLHKTARAFAVLIGFCLVCGMAACGGTQPDTEGAVSEAETDTGEPMTTEEGKGETQEEKETTAEEPETTTEERETEPQAETADAAVKQVRDTEYETLIAGGLSKEELEFVLAYGPQEIPEQGFRDEDYVSLLNSLCMASEENAEGSMIEVYGVDAEWNGMYSLADVNRMFRSFTDRQLAEGDDTLSGYNVRVEGDAVIFAGASIGRVSNAAVTSAVYTEEEMEICYNYETRTNGMAAEGIPKKEETRKALLKPGADGRYQIVRIEAAGGREAEAAGAGEQETTGPAAADTQGFPAGVYFSADPSGGSFRGSLTVDPAGVAVYMEWSGGTGEGYETIYQMAADRAASVSDGVAAYVLQFREENEFRLTDDGREVTAHSESGEDRILYYNAGQGTLQEEDGFLWAPEE